MADVSTDLLEMALREIAAARSEPWYPSVYAQATGVARDTLDHCLDLLRLAGLVRLTDWEQGRGQGYALTPEGQVVLDNPRLLARLREGKEVPRPRLRTAPSEERSLRGSGTHWDRAEAIRAALLSAGRPGVTYALLWLNGLVFGVGLWLAMRQNITNEYLGSGQGGGEGGNLIRHDLGGLLLSDLTVSGQWWRLLSYCFVHGGVLHLAMNMFALYMFGGLVEKMWGPGRYLVVYLVSGLGGAVLQMVAEPNVFMVGASGCLCGLLASMGVWVMMNRPYLPAKLASSWMNNLLVNAMLIVFISMLPGISWAGHLGGGLGGAAVSVPLVWSLYGRGGQRWLGWAGAAAVPLVSLLLLYQSLAPARDVDETDPELNKARAEYAPLERRTDALGRNPYEAVVKDFLEGTKSPERDADVLKKAQPVLTKAIAQLKAQARVLEAAREQFRNATIRAHIRLAQAYAAKLLAFYEALPEKLQADNWPQNREELRRLWAAVEAAGRELSRSPLYRRLHQ